MCAAWPSPTCSSPISRTCGPRSPPSGYIWTPMVEAVAGEGGDQDAGRLRSHARPPHASST
ncbi:hypothetical protein DAT35_56305 [Vitiosangium sp. GDMCC 1.1324]|nr:hypothetical protein DAT35_56305 [Vitiosangium sp. GDMCC 1.1324]